MDLEIGNDIAAGLGSPAAAPAPAPTPSPTPAAADASPATAAPATPEPAAPAPAPAAAPSAEPPKQDSVPLPTFLDMRDENKRLKAELAKATEARPASPAAPVPSFKDDPDGFAAYLADQTNRTAMSTRFEVSELTAREKHGDETVSSAMDWGMQRSAESPAFAAEYLKQKNPIAWAVQQMKRAKLMDELGDNEEAFVTSRAEKFGFVKAPPAAAPAPAASAAPQPQAAAPAAPAQQQPASPAAPTRSLASAPSAGGPAIVPTGDFAAFDAINPGR